MKNKFALAFALFLFCFLVSTTLLHAQKNDIVYYRFDTSSTYKFVLQSGDEITGQYVEKTDAIVVIKMQSISRIEIKLNEIESVTRVAKQGDYKGKFSRGNSHATRYFVSPSAFNLKKGEGYYQNTMLLLNSFNLGITDNFSFGGGLEILSTVLSISESNITPIFFVTPKVSFKVTEKLYLGVGDLLIGSLFEGQGFNILYGLGTYGTRNDNVTLGLGTSTFFNARNSPSPTVTLSGMKRISNRMAFVSENWILPGSDNGGLYSYGIRFFGEKMAVDLAFVNNADIAEFLIIGVPFVDFVVKF